MADYVAEMRYEGNLKPTLARVVRVDRSKTLAAEDADFTVLVAEAASDIEITLPEQAEEKRGFRVVNLGAGKLTLRAPAKSQIAGRDSIEIGAGEQLEGAVSPLEAVLKEVVALPK